MKEKLYQLAGITSPILALYGLLPIYLLNELDNLLILISFLLLAVLIFLFWLINILLLDRHLGRWRYFWSFLFTFILHFAVMLMAPNVPVNEERINLLIYPLGGTVAVNAIILIMIHVIMLQNEKEMAEQEIKNLKLNQLETQKQVLLQQLQPHFLFNALSTLKSLIGDRPKDAEDYVVKLSEFLRYSVQPQLAPWASLADELQFAKDYLDLQKVRFGEALQAQIHIPGSIVSYKVPVYAVQSLIENAIKHNAFTERRPLLIRLSVADGRLAVSNNRIPKRLAHTSGTGLRNLQDRYLIMGLGPVEILDENDQFTVKIPLLPL